jgi:hypothetical protein
MPVYRMMLLVHRLVNREAYTLFRLDSVKCGRFLLCEAFRRKLSTAEAADCSTLTFKITPGEGAGARFEFLNGWIRIESQC